jgi:hypothetical protein
MSSCENFTRFVLFRGYSGFGLNLGVFATLREIFFVFIRVDSRFFFAFFVPFCGYSRDPCWPAIFKISLPAFWAFRFSQSTYFSQRTSSALLTFYWISLRIDSINLGATRESQLCKATSASSRRLQRRVMIS